MNIQSELFQLHSEEFGLYIIELMKVLIAWSFKSILNKTIKSQNRSVENIETYTGTILWQRKKTFDNVKTSTICGALQVRGDHVLIPFRFEVEEGEIFREDTFFSVYSIIIYGCRRRRRTHPNNKVRDWIHERSLRNNV